MICEHFAKIVLRFVNFQDLYHFTLAPAIHEQTKACVCFISIIRQTVVSRASVSLWSSVLGGGYT
jgi:hypothetical protein